MTLALTSYDLNAGVTESSSDPMLDLYTEEDFDEVSPMTVLAAPLNSSPDSGLTDDDMLLLLQGIIPPPPPPAGFLDFCNLMGIAPPPPPPPPVLSAGFIFDLLLFRLSRPTLVYYYYYYYYIIVLQYFFCNQS